MTGGCGFIGSNYVRHLLGVRPQAKAVVLDKLTYAGHRPNLEKEEKSGRCEVVLVWFLKKYVFKEEKKKKSEAAASGKREGQEEEGLPAVDRPKRFVYGGKK